MKDWSITGIIIAIIMIGFGIIYPVPQKNLYVDDSYKAYQYDWAKNKGAQYVGGDAYNYQIEASLKAGYIAGVLAMKTITFVGGILLFFFSTYTYNKATLLEKSNEISNNISLDVEEIKKICENP